MPASEDPLMFQRVRKRVARRALRVFATRLREEIAGGRAFLCLLTDDSELRRLNRQFLGKDYPTDVLSFPEPGPDKYLGEMAISVERASKQAAERGHTVEEEIQILMLHGLLHLMGLDHEKDRGTMARAEIRMRKKLGLPSGLIERARE
jgi:probable rRNA maturation factor